MCIRDRLEEISMLMGYEVTRDLPTKEVEIETPLCKTTARHLSGKKVGIVPIPVSYTHLDVYKRQAPTVTTISASQVRYANWYSEVKARCRLFPNATIYDFTTCLLYTSRCV